MRVKSTSSVFRSAQGDALVLQCADGRRDDRARDGPEVRHLMSMNFSAPGSAPRPTSVTTPSAEAGPVGGFLTELQPCAMLASRPAVDRRRGVLEGLHEVGGQRVARMTVIAPLAFRVAGRHRLLVAGVADDDVAQALP